MAFWTFNSKENLEECSGTAVLEWTGFVMQRGRMSKEVVPRADCGGRCGAQGSNAGEEN